MKQRDIAIINRNFADFNPIVCGHHVCDGGHNYGPHIREYYLLHYVESGSGTFIRGGKTYRVHKNQMFAIVPGEVTKYTADEKDPWVYTWIGFTGNMAERFAALPPVFDFKTSIFSQILEADSYSSCREEFLASMLFKLYCTLFENPESRHDYVKQACDYIAGNYSGNIRILDIAETVGLERTYLSKIFRQKMGVSMQEYLINVRLEHACNLLKQGYNVTQTAVMCGYEDTFAFSKIFKKKYGESPKNYSKQSNDRS